MDNSTLINQLADEVDNLFHIYQGLAGHIQDGSPAITRLRSQEVRQLGTTVQRMQAYIETLACRLRDQSKGVAHEPWILHTRVQPRVLISASLQKIVSKYHLEGQHEIWVNPSGTVLDPFERPVGISTGESDELLFQKGFVKASLDVYYPDQFSVTLIGTAENLEKATGTQIMQADTLQERYTKSLLAIRNRSESNATYTVTYSDEGWHVHFQTGIAPHFGLEPHYTLRELIERVKSHYPEYRPRLTAPQLEDYVRELNDLVDTHGYQAFVPHAVNALMRCAPPDMRPSTRIALQEEAKSAFETGVGLQHVIKQLSSQQQKQQLDQNQHRSQTL
jgi:hypothetical protein